MEIDKKVDGAKAVYSVVGSLDTMTSPDLQAAIESMDAAVRELTLDFSALEYISSAGLRVLLTANRKLKAVGGELLIKGSNESVREIFDMTGFGDILKLI